MAHGFGLAQGFIKKPSHALIFGLLMFGAGLFVSISNWRQLQNLPAQPTLIDITQAHEVYQSKTDAPLWVSLQNSKWDCDSLRSNSGKDEETEIIATDSNQSIIVLVNYSDSLTCEEIVQNNPIGYLTEMTERRIKIFTTSGKFNLSKYPEVDQYFDLCAYCGPTNSGIGVVIGAFVSVGGLLLYPLSRRRYNKRFSQ